MKNKRRDKKLENISLDEKLELAQFFYLNVKNKARRRRKQKEKYKRDF